jgi:hypothetical protein
VTRNTSIWCFDFYNLENNTVINLNLVSYTIIGLCCCSLDVIDKLLKILYVTVLPVVQNVIIDMREVRNLRNPMKVSIMRKQVFYWHIQSHFPYIETIKARVGKKCLMLSIK